MTEEIGGEKTKGSWKRPLIILIVLLLAAWGAYAFFFKGEKEVLNEKVTLGGLVDSSKYQAVFLSNGQVYFGKITQEREGYVSMENVYYLVLKQPLQNQQEGEGQNPEQAQAKPEYSLVKLGREIHGPISMDINSDQILFIENLADDSKVVNAINNPPTN